MSNPFKIIKGGQAEAKPVPKKFATFDTKRALGDRMMAKHLADRDKAIDKLRAQGKL